MSCRSSNIGHAGQMGKTGSRLLAAIAAIAGLGVLCLGVAQAGEASGAKGGCGAKGCTMGAHPVQPADQAGPAKDAAAIAKKDAYPLGTCVVSGDKLGGSMGKPVSYNYKGREIRFCCSGCIKDFKKDPANYLQKLDDAVIKQQKPAYPLATCVVSGQKLGGSMGKPIDYVYKDRLVRFCCKGCIKTFNKEPAKYLAMIDKAAKNAPAQASGTAGNSTQHS